MNQSLSLLFLDDSDDRVAPVVSHIACAGFRVEFERAGTRAAFVEALERKGWDAVLADGAAADSGGVEAWRELGERGLDLPLIVLAGKDGETAALQAMKEGAADYVFREDLTRLAPLIGREMRIRDERRRRREEEAILRKNEERYRLLAETTRDLVGLHSLEGKLLYASRSVRELLGFEPDDLEGADFFEAVHPEDRARVREEFARVASEGETIPPFEYRVRRNDGVYIWVETLVEPVKDETGAVTGLQSSSRDVSERREIEQRFRQVQKMESLGNLAGGIAHDFNNILAVINGYSELILGLPQADEQVKKFAREINRGGERASQLVRQILTFARKTNTTFDTVQPNELVENLGDLLKETFPRSISIVCDLDRDVAAIRADAQQVSQVLMNLSVNSRDAMKETGGTLTLATGMVEAAVLPAKFGRAGDSDYVCIRVGDTGCGMGKETAQRIFEPFFTTKDVGEGTGLGLAVAYGIMQNHCGYIDVESEEDEGTVFTLYFPTSMDTESAGGEPVKSPEPAGGEETLLLVEDEILVAEWLRWSLSQKGYRVLWAMNGLDAMKIYENEKDSIALVLSDHGLPGMSGWELYMKLKDKHPKLTFVIATGYLDPQLREGMLKSGVADFLNKPFQRKELLRRIRRLLDAGVAMRAR